MERELATPRQRRKAAKELFRKAKKELEKNAVISRERLLVILKTGNKELLPPDGITAETDLNPEMTVLQQLRDSFLPEVIEHTDPSCAAFSTTYRCRVRRVLDAEHYGVTLTESYWERGGGSAEHVKKWVYPDKGELGEGEW